MGALARQYYAPGGQSRGKRRKDRGWHVEGVYQRYAVAYRITAEMHQPV
jgi:hypothetical protein